MSATMGDPKLLEQLTASGSIPDPMSPAGRTSGVLTRAKIEAILGAAKAAGEHPLFDEHVQAVEDYRRVHNTTDPDAG